jgi:hypothetical protein
MLPSHMLTSTVTIEYADETAVDRYNRPLAGETVVVDVPAYYRPRRTDTKVAGGELITAGMQVILQPDVELDNVVAVYVEGRRYLLDGQPQPHWNPNAKRLEYQVVLLRRGTSEVG